MHSTFNLRDFPVLSSFIVAPLYKKAASRAVLDPRTYYILINAYGAFHSCRTCPL